MKTFKLVLATIFMLLMAGCLGSVEKSHGFPESDEAQTTDGQPPGDDVKSTDSRNDGQAPASEDRSLESDLHRPMREVQWATDAWVGEDVVLLLEIEFEETPNPDDWQDCSILVTASGRSGDNPQWKHVAYYMFHEGVLRGYGGGGGGGAERFARVQAGGHDTHDHLAGLAPEFEWWSSKTQVGLVEQGRHTFVFAATDLDLVPGGFDPDHTMALDLSCTEEFVLSRIAVASESWIYDSRMGDEGLGASIQGTQYTPGVSAVVDATYEYDLSEDVFFVLTTQGGVQKTRIQVEHPEDTFTLDVAPLQGMENVHWFDGPAGRHKITVDHHAGASAPVGSGFYYGGLLAASWRDEVRLEELTQST